MTQTQKTTITSFTDLKVWQEAHRLAITVYGLTKKFPKEELYVLTSQMKRCAISISSNIAEGFSRKGSKEKLQFYYTARASLTELQTQLLLARDVDYLSQEEFLKIADQTVNVHKLLHGLIRGWNNKKANC